MLSTVLVTDKLLTDMQQARALKIIAIVCGVMPTVKRSGIQTPPRRTLVVNNYWTYGSKSFVQFSLAISYKLCS